MASWMKQLANHYEKMREKYPDDDLMIVFDIDNTIIDMREMIAYVLKTYDRRHGTDHFAELRPLDLTINENQVEDLLREMCLEQQDCDAINAWYLDQRWTTEAILRSHRPYRGVMEVIRWFQTRPRTFVGLNTGRTEDVRQDTLKSLNRLGERYKVKFRSDLLHMFPGFDSGEVTDSKVAGIRKFQKMGFRVFAVVDNEPDNLASIERADDTGEILPVHADTIFDSKRSTLPETTVSGTDYDLTELISEESLPSHVQFVWHGANDRVNLRQFLASDVQWCEFDIRMDEGGESVVLRADTFERRPRGESEEVLTLDRVVPPLIRAGKSVKLDLKHDGALVDRVIEILEKFDVEDDRLWINGDPADIAPDGFRRIRKQFPGATIQCPLREHATMILISPTLVRDKLEEYRSWGVDRISVRWGVDDIPAIINRLEEWGFEVNLYNVPDLEGFLRAVLLQPTSVTADFNFPEWHYFGRGSGENFHHHTYTLDDHER